VPFPTDLVCTLNVFLHFAFLPYPSELRYSSRVFSDSRALNSRAAFRPRPLDLQFFRPVESHFVTLNT
jgi:hypothetical protein